MVNVYGDNDEPDVGPPEEEEEDEEAQKEKGLKEFEILSDKEDIYHEKTKPQAPPDEGILLAIYRVIMRSHVVVLP